MSITSKALFVIERNLCSDLTLQQIADYCSVSRFHLAHAFGEAVGFSVVEYLRARRLTQAAQALVWGADDILSLALDCRYSSHEAFTRAFKAQFNRTPEEVRKTGSLAGLPLVQPLPHKESKAVQLPEPRIQSEGELLFVGASHRVAYRSVQEIAGHWQQFMAGSYKEIINKADEPPIGVSATADTEGLEYMCSGRVTAFGAIPRGCRTLIMAPETYAVFAHDGHITQLRQTYEAIWNEWFPASGRTPLEAPIFERHNATFDPRTGNGGVTIWIPIQP